MSNLSKQLQELFEYGDEYEASVQKRIIEEILSLIETREEDLCEEIKGSIMTNHDEVMGVVHRIDPDDIDHILATRWEKERAK